jgi:type II secretory pathway component PulF
MVDTGEMTGSLDQMLLKMSEFYEEEGKLRARQMVNVVSILCLLTVAVYIGYIVISFYIKTYAGIGSELQDLAE